MEDGSLTPLTFGADPGTQHGFIFVKISGNDAEFWMKNKCGGWYL